MVLKEVCCLDSGLLETAQGELPEDRKCASLLYASRPLMRSPVDLPSSDAVRDNSDQAYVPQVIHEDSAGCTRPKYSSKRLPRIYASVAPHRKD